MTQMQFQQQEDEDTPHLKRQKIDFQAFKSPILSSTEEFNYHTTETKPEQKRHAEETIVENSYPFSFSLFENDSVSLPFYFKCPVSVEHSPTKEAKQEDEEEKEIKKSHVRFSMEEDKIIEYGLAKFGPDWSQIIHWGQLNRTPKQVKARYDRLLLQNAKRSFEMNKENEEDDKRKSPVKKIEDYFKPQPTPVKKKPSEEEEIKREEAWKRKLFELEEKNEKLTSELNQLSKENYQNRTFYEDKLTECVEKFDKKIKKMANALYKSLLSEIRRDHKEDRLKNSEALLKYGSFEKEGWLFEELKQKQKLLLEQKDEIEKQRKLLNQKRKKQQANGQSNSPVEDDSGFVQPKQILDFHEEEEALKMKMNSLKKEETELQMLNEKYLIEREILWREYKRIRDEDCSQFKGNPVLNQRYLLMKLIGRGGFSEVFQAFDLFDSRQVACKIQTVNQSWNIEKKKNYIKHAMREFKIHRALNHPRIVQFFDIFEIDENSFCIVLEFCPGSDLDQYVRQMPNKCLPEKEARQLIGQLFSALKYLNQISPPIIHYDLKPGNILMNPDGLKITDFGLSKIMANADMTDGGVELTSQGAGTYWYLPPECFIRGAQPPKISSKVDVWSAGVIYYQLLYGIKPFGQDQSQNTILAENTIVKAYSVVFPAKPNVSIETKEFIKKCLEYRKEIRPDVLTLSEDPYLKPKK